MERMSNMIVCPECGDKRCPKAALCENACQDESRSDLDDLKCVPGPCAKAVVTCKILGTRGDTYIGTNECNNPQRVCPREDGEDYTKCKTICDQQGHAELQAIELAGADCREGIAILDGHTYFCEYCQHALFDAGIALIGINGARAERRP